MLPHIFHWWCSVLLKYLCCPLHCSHQVTCSYQVTTGSVVSLLAVRHCFEGWAIMMTAPPGELCKNFWCSHQHIGLAVQPQSNQTPKINILKAMLKIQILICSQIQRTLDANYLNWGHKSSPVQETGFSFFSFFSFFRYSQWVTD